MSVVFSVISKEQKRDKKQTKTRKRIEMLEIAVQLERPFAVGARSY